MATAVQSFWDATASQSIPATIVSANVQNLPPTPGGTSPTVTGFDITFEVPVGTVTSPLWGVGSNNQGIADPSTWSLVSGPTVTGGVAKRVIRYIGPGIPTYSTRQPTVWIQTQAAVAGQSVTSYLVAIHDNGDTSTDSEAATTALGLQGTLPVDSTHEGFDWVYTPPTGAVALAATSAASGGGTGNNPRIVNVTIPLAAGVSLTSAQLQIDWSPKNSSASVGATSPGGLTWSGSPTNVATVTLSASAGIADSTSISVTFDKANLPSSYTLTLSAFVNGSPTRSSRVMTGTLPA